MYLSNVVRTFFEKESKLTLSYKNDYEVHFYYDFTHTTIKKLDNGNIKVTVYRTDEIELSIYLKNDVEPEVIYNAYTVLMNKLNEIRKDNTLKIYINS